jgi:hypothetical protein
LLAHAPTRGNASAYVREAMSAAEHVTALIYKPTPPTTKLFV